MGLSMKNLIHVFESAMMNDVNFVGVKIQMEGFAEPEIIINSSENFESKLAYYKRAYNDDLTLKTFNGIKIIGFTHGDSFAEIQEDLLGV